MTLNFMHSQFASAGLNACTCKGVQNADAISLVSSQCSPIKSTDFLWGLFKTLRNARQEFLQWYALIYGDYDKIFCYTIQYET